jgi:hypothetical protein
MERSNEVPAKRNTRHTGHITPSGPAARAAGNLLDLPCRTGCYMGMYTAVRPYCIMYPLVLCPRLAVSLACARGCGGPPHPGDGPCTLHRHIIAGPHRLDHVTDSFATQRGTCASHESLRPRDDIRRPGFALLEVLIMRWLLINPVLARARGPSRTSNDDRSE